MQEGFRKGVLNYLGRVVLENSPDGLSPHFFFEPAVKLLEGGTQF